MNVYERKILLKTYKRKIPETNVVNNNKLLMSSPEF